MKRILLVISLGIFAATSCFANTSAENEMISLLKEIKANGAGGGGASDVTVHDSAVTSRFLAVDANGKLGINALPNVTIGAALPAGANVIGGVTQSGTWTVQPGNTANTTAWKFDGSGVTQPISAASLPLPTLAATSTKQSDGTQKTQIVNAAGTEVSTGTLVNSVAYQASLVLKASAGTLISVAGYNSKASAQFIQLYNSATVPADTAVPVLTFTVAATSNFSYDVPITGIPFTTGIAVANSSTGPTKTVGSADCYFTAVVR